MINLFLKYAPQTFKDVVGQETTVKELSKRAIDKNFPQCIYFTGYTGTGKTVLSRIVSKSLLCKNLDKEGNPCNTCPTCIAIHNGQKLLNYFEENGSNCNIDRMREIEEMSQKKIMLADSNIKVFYIDEIQEIASKSKEAMKNLLKLLEKPSKNNYFILGSMDDSNIPEAVRNRCVTYKLKNLTVDQISERLAYICKSENIEIDSVEKANVLLSISENSQGSLRTAISQLERVIYSEIWDEKKLVDELELYSNEYSNSIITNLLCGKFIKEDKYDISKKLVDTIIQKLNILYKSECGISINGYEKSLINKIGLPFKDSKNNKIVIESSLNCFYDLLKYNYTTPALMEYTLLHSKSTNKEIIEVLNEDKPVEIPRAERKPRNA